MKKVKHILVSVDERQVKENLRNKHTHTYLYIYIYIYIYIYMCVCMCVCVCVLKENRKSYLRLKWTWPKKLWDNSSRIYMNLLYSWKSELYRFPTLNFLLSFYSPSCYNKKKTIDPHPESMIHPATVVLNVGTTVS